MATKCRRSGASRFVTAPDTARITGVAVTRVTDAATVVIVSEVTQVPKCTA